MKTTTIYSLCGTLTTPLQIRQTLFGTYVDGKRCFVGSEGFLYFSDSKLQVIHYVLRKARGYDLVEGEHLFYRDHNPLNVYAENIEILKQFEGERNDEFSYRLNLFKQWKYYRTLEYPERIPNWEYRYKNAVGVYLDHQIATCQKQVDKYWRKHWKSFPTQDELWQSCEEYRKFVFFDVIRSDLVLTEPPENVRLKMRAAGMIKCQ